MKILIGVSLTSIENASDLLSLIPEIVNLLGIAVSALVAFIVAKVQSKNAEIQLDKQIKAEVEKIKIQYELEQKRDNINFLNKFKLEKLTELYDLVAQNLRYINKVTLLFEKLLRGKQLSEISKEEIDIFLKERNIIEEEYFEKGITKQISIATNYFPNFKNKWEQISYLEHKIIHLYPDQILGTLTIKREEYSRFLLPDNYTLNNYLEDTRGVQSEYLSYIEIIAKEIGNVMDSLEPSHRTD